MKVLKNNIRGTRDDSLYGLLSPHKGNYTYIQVLISEEKKSILLQLADNPKKFFAAPPERLQGYRLLRRLELGIIRLSLKYITPESLINVIGPLLGLSIPIEKVTITDDLKKGGCYIIESALKYKMKIIQGVRKLLNMSPQKRYEILEKYFTAG